MGTISAVNESLLQEVTDRQAGDSALQSEVDALEAALAQEQSAREAADVALDARLDSIEAAPHIEGRKEVKTLGAGDLAYVDMAGLALDNTMMVITGGIVHHEGESYTLSTQGSVTRLTFAGDLASGGLNPLAEGDKVYCQYLVNAAAGQSGGGGTGGGVDNTPHTYTIGDVRFYNLQDGIGEPSTVDLYIEWNGSHNDIEEMKVYRFITGQGFVEQATIPSPNYGGLWVYGITRPAYGATGNELLCKIELLRSGLVDADKYVNLPALTVDGQ
jgi:hypothetical protein